MGKSFMLALYAMLRALFHQGSKIVIVGAAFRQAKVVFDYCEELWENGPSCGTSSARQGPQQPRQRPPPRRRPLHPADGRQHHHGPAPGRRQEDSRPAAPTSSSPTSSRPSRRTSSRTSSRGFAAVSPPAPSTTSRSAREQGGPQGARPVDRGPRGLEASEAEHWATRRSSPARPTTPSTTSANTGGVQGLHRIPGRPKKLAEIFNEENVQPATSTTATTRSSASPSEACPRGFMDEKHVAQAGPPSTRHLPDGVRGVLRDRLQRLLPAEPHRVLRRRPPKEPHRAPQLRRGRLHPPSSAARRAKYVIGVDPASQSDNFSIVVLAMHPDHRRVVYCWTTTTSDAQGQAEARAWSARTTSTATAPARSAT
jgi:hypothetical protein